MEKHAFLVPSRTFSLCKAIKKQIASFRQFYKILICYTARTTRFPYPPPLPPPLQNFAGLTSSHCSILIFQCIMQLVPMASSNCAVELFYPIIQKLLDSSSSGSSSCRKKYPFSAALQRTSLPPSPTPPAPTPTTTSSTHSHAHLAAPQPNSTK